MSCVACSGTAMADGYTNDGRLLRCDECGTRRLDPSTRTSPADYGAAYRDGADPHKLARLVELFDAHAEPGGRVLDVGCGDGRFLAALAARGAAVHGLDLDPGGVAAARTRGIPVTLGAAPDARCPGPFDTVTLWDLIEHADDPAAVARWLATVVAPGGRILVLTPDAGSIFDRLAAFERAATRGRSARIEQLCLNRYHLHRFTAAGLICLFERAGFRTRSVTRLQLFSLHPERYLAGFAPGIAGFSQRPRVDAALSRAAFATVVRLGIANKLFYVGERPS